MAMRRWKALKGASSMEADSRWVSCEVQPAPEQALKDHVYGCHRGDRDSRVVADRDEPSADDDADLRAPVVFNSGREAERPARAGVFLNCVRGGVAAAVCRVISEHARVRVMLVDHVERQYPVARNAVLPARIRRKGVAGAGTS